MYTTFFQSKDRVCYVPHLAMASYLNIPTAPRCCKVDRAYFDERGIERYDLIDFATNRLFLGISLWDLKGIPSQVKTI